MGKSCACPRCGFESSCSHRRWVDRHPVAAVLFALPAGYTLVGVMLVYPWFTIPATIIVCALLLNRAARRRAAIAARADWEHREMMVRAMGRLPAAPPLPAPRSAPPSTTPQVVRQMPVASAPQRPSSRHVMNRWPTTPIQIRRNR